MYNLSCKQSNKQKQQQKTETNKTKQKFSLRKTEIIYFLIMDKGRSRVDISLNFNNLKRRDVQA